MTLNRTVPLLVLLSCCTDPADPECRVFGTELSLSLSDVAAPDNSHVDITALGPATLSLDAGALVMAFDGGATYRLSAGGVPLPFAGGERVYAHIDQHCPWDCTQTVLIHTLDGTEAGALVLAAWNARELPALEEPRLSSLEGWCTRPGCSDVQLLLLRAETSSTSVLLRPGEESSVGTFRVRSAIGGRIVEVHGDDCGSVNDELHAGFAVDEGA